MELVCLRDSIQTIWLHRDDTSLEYYIRIVTKPTVCLLIDLATQSLRQGWARGSFVEAEAEVEAERSRQRRGKAAMFLTEARQGRGRGRELEAEARQSEIDSVCVILKN